MSIDLNKLAAEVRLWHRAHQPASIGLNILPHLPAIADALEELARIKAEVIKAIADEEELLGDPPADIAALLEHGDLNSMVMYSRVLVKCTKRKITERVEKLFASQP